MRCSASDLILLFALSATPLAAQDAKADLPDAPLPQVMPALKALAPFHGVGFKGGADKGFMNSISLFFGSRDVDNGSVYDFALKQNLGGRFSLTAGVLNGNFDDPALAARRFSLRQTLNIPNGQPSSLVTLMAPGTPQDRATSGFAVGLQFFPHRKP